MSNLCLLKGTRLHHLKCLVNISQTKIKNLESLINFFVILFHSPKYYNGILTSIILSFVEEEDDDDSFPPEFIRRPKSAHVDEGSPAKFTCQIAADPPATVRWEKDGQILEHGGRFKVG